MSRKEIGMTQTVISRTLGESILLKTPLGYITITLEEYLENDILAVKVSYYDGELKKVRLSTGDPLLEISKCICLQLMEINEDSHAQFLVHHPHFIGVFRDEAIVSDEA